MLKRFLVVSGKNPLYSEAKKSGNFSNEKNVKIIKWTHAFKGYASSHNAEIFNSFNLELQLKDIESTIKNKLIDLLSELKGFKFMATLVLEFKKIQSDDKRLYSTFLFELKAETIINESVIDDIFESTYSNIISNI